MVLGVSCSSYDRYPTSADHNQKDQKKKSQTHEAKYEQHHEWHVTGKYQAPR